MRIVHTALRYPPATGGAETYIRDIAQHTRSVPERDVRVVTSAMRTHHPPSALNPHKLLNDPPYVQRLHYATTPFVAYPRLQALTYYLNHHKPDILHSYGFWYHPADATARYAHAHNIPFIFHPIYYSNNIRRKPLWRLYQRTIGKQTFAAADIVVVISPFEKKLIEQAEMPVKRFELIPPGIDTQKFSEPSSDIFAQHGIKGKILLTVGRISHGKGLDDLITILPNILPAHPDIQLVIVGEDFGAKQSLQVQSDKQGTRNHVHFLGKIPASELVAAYQHADIYVHPSHYEAFGIVLAESLAAHTPVIARNVAAAPFVAPHMEAGLLFNNQTELIQHITVLLENYNLRQKLTKQGNARIQQMFALPKMIDAIIKLYAKSTR